jgi:hypothetical protein
MTVPDAYRTDLAHIHDAGTGDLARHAAAFLTDLLRRQGTSGGLVVDLGCGSGQGAAELVAGGDDILGVHRRRRPLRRRPPHRLRRPLPAALPPLRAA